MPRRHSPSHTTACPHYHHQHHHQHPHHEYSHAAAAAAHQQHYHCQQHRHAAVPLRQKHGSMTMPPLSTSTTMPSSQHPQPHHQHNHNHNHGLYKYHLPLRQAPAPAAAAHDGATESRQHALRMTTMLPQQQHLHQQQQQKNVLIENSSSFAVTTHHHRNPPAATPAAAAADQLHFVDDGRCMVRDFCMPREITSTSSSSAFSSYNAPGIGGSSNNDSALAQQQFNRNQIILSSFAICFQKFHFIEPPRREFSLHRSGEFRLEDPNWCYLFSPKHDSYDAYLIVVRKSCTRKNITRDVIMHYDMKLVDPHRPSCAHVLPVTGKAVVISNTTRFPQELHILLQNPHFIGCDYEIRKIPEDIVEQVQRTPGYDLWVFVQVQRTKERRLLSAFDPDIIQPNGPLADVDVVVAEMDDWLDDDINNNNNSTTTAETAPTTILLSPKHTGATAAAFSSTSPPGSPRKRLRVDETQVNRSSSLSPASSTTTTASTVKSTLSTHSSSSSAINYSCINSANTTQHHQHATLPVNNSLSAPPVRTVRMRLDRNILAARSGFFRDELTRLKILVDKGAADDNYQTWQVHINCKVGIFQKIIRYIYFGEIDPITLDYLEAVDMFKAVHRLRLGELKKAILERMAFILQEGKYLLEAYCFANKYQIAPLKRHVEMLSLKFPGKTFQGDDWRSFVEYCPNLVANMLEGVL